MTLGTSARRIVVSLSLSFTFGAVYAQCTPGGGVARDSNNWVQADALRPVRSLDPSFFGFNLEWLEFQRGLWDSATHQVRPGVTDIFKAFPGAVYRFPGGTNSNHIDWRDAVGPIAARAPRRHVTWMGPIRSEFGVDEYLQFVRSVNGQAWYVANLYGSLENAVAPSLLASNAGELAAYLTKRAEEGYPPVLRWELGNELDRAQYKWTPEKLAQIALQVAGPIAEKAPGAKFVHLQQEYPAQQDRGYTANRYNTELRAQLASLKPEFAMHFYYDGPPDTPPIEYFLRQLCQVVAQAKAEGLSAKVWVTESGRVPNGFWAKTPKELWPATANLEAAISVADMLIALAQIPEAQGAFTHSLVASTSPWPLLHVRANGEVGPSATLLAMKVLREFMLPVVLQGRQASSATGTLGAGYVVRSAIAADAARDNFAAWAINRSNAPQILELRISNAKESLSYERSIGITDEQVNASNYAVSNRVEIARNHLTVNPKGRGSWSITLPPNSVSALRFSVPK